MSYMDPKSFISNELKIVVLSLSVDSFVQKDGTITQRKISSYITDPSRRAKINKYKKSMMKNFWNDRDIRKYKFSHEIQPIIFRKDGVLWEGGHRMTALTCLYLEEGIKDKVIDFIVILGWPVEKTNYSLYILDEKSRRYKRNAVAKLIKNNFKDTLLKEQDI